MGEKENAFKFLTDDYLELSNGVIIDLSKVCKFQIIEETYSFHAHISFEFNNNFTVWSATYQSKHEAKNELHEIIKEYDNRKHKKNEIQI